MGKAQGVNLKKISKKVYIFAGVALVVLAAVVVLVLYNKPYEVLVTGVSSGEASSILSYLDSLGVTDYKVENNDTILVPRGQEAALKGRILMAAIRRPDMPILHITTMWVRFLQKRNGTMRI